MHKIILRYIGLASILFLSMGEALAQEGFGTQEPDKSAVIDMTSERRGLLIPRVALVSTTNNTSPITSPANSLLVYNTASVGDVTPGYYYWETNRWVRFAVQNDISELSLLGDVTGLTGATKVVAIQGSSILATLPMANQVLTFNGSEWAPTSTTHTLGISANKITSTVNDVSDSVILTEDNLISTKTISGSTINVIGGAGATLADVTLEVKPGTDGQVLVTQTGTAMWVDQSTIVPSTTNELSSTANTMTSVVNAISSNTPIINTIANTLTGTNLVTVVNGVSSASIDLENAIRAGQNTTTIVDGLNTTISSSLSGSNTVYEVNVSQAAVQAAQKTSVVGAGTGVSITAATNGNETTYTVATDAANITLGGDVTGPANATVVGRIQGTSVNSTAPSTTGQALVYDGSQWTPGKPKVDAADITVAKNLSNADGSITVGNGTGATLVDATLSITDQGITTSKLGDNSVTNAKIGPDAITSAKILNGTILPEDLANAGNNQTLVTDASGVPGWVNQSTLGTAADNGLTKTGNTIQLGGALTKATTITTTPTNSLAVLGLLPGTATDKIVVADANGVLKQMKAAMPKFFYMPSIAMPTSAAHFLPGDGFTVSGGVFRVNLHTRYSTQFATPKASNSSKTTTLPILPPAELDYYITSFDEAVFETVTVSDAGVLTYKIKSTAQVTAATFMNIVFAVKP